MLNSKTPTDRNRVPTADQPSVITPASGAWSRLVIILSADSVYGNNTPYWEFHGYLGAPYSDDAVQHAVDFLIAYNYLPKGPERPGASLRCVTVF